MGKWKELAQPDDIHTCHADCQNPACVAVRQAVAEEWEDCAVPLHEQLGKIPADIRFGVKDGDDWRAGTTWYPIGAMCQLAAAELRRLHEVNAELVEALWELVKWYAARDEDDVLLPDRNQNPEICQAMQALAKAQGDNNE